MKTFKFAGLLALFLAVVFSSTMSAQTITISPDTIYTPIVMPDGTVRIIEKTVSVKRDGTFAIKAIFVPSSAAATSSGGGHSSGFKVTGVENTNVPQQFLTNYGSITGPVKLSTFEEEGETESEHALRHAIALNLLKAQHPPGSSPGDSGGDGPVIQPGSQFFKTDWVDQNGMNQSVVTVRKTGESVANWAGRHGDGVAALMAVFPPAPQTSMADDGELPEILRMPVSRPRLRLVA